MSHRLLFGVSIMYSGAMSHVCYYLKLAMRCMTFYEMCYASPSDVYHLFFGLCSAAHVLGLSGTCGDLLLYSAGRYSTMSFRYLSPDLWNGANMLCGLELYSFVSRRNQHVSFVSRTSPRVSGQLPLDVSLLHPHLGTIMCQWAASLCYLSVYVRR